MTATALTSQVCSSEPPAAGSLLVGTSRYMAGKRAECALLGPRRVHTVVQGETGTGKSVIVAELARHYAVRFGVADPLVRVSGAQWRAGITPADLLGHSDNAYTDARRATLGLVRQAAGKIVWWDEGDDTPAEGQQLLVDLLDGKPMRALGETREFVPDVRVVFVVHRPLGELVHEARLRRDVAARLRMTPMVLRPLREHIEDLPALAAHFLPLLAAKHGERVPLISHEAMARLLAYSWPENVRELGIVLEAALIQAVSEDAENPVIEVYHLGEELQPPAKRNTRRIGLARVDVENALRLSSGNVLRAARELGVEARTLQRRMKEQGVQAAAYRG